MENDSAGMQEGLRLGRGASDNGGMQEILERMLPGLVKLLQEAGCSMLMEGVEDESEAMLVLECGADLAQGYYFGQPAWPSCGEEAVAIPQALNERFRMPLRAGGMRSRLLSRIK